MMLADDVTETLRLALETSGIEVTHRPRQLSDSSLSYIAADLAEWLDPKKKHVCSAR